MRLLPQGLVPRHPGRNGQMVHRVLGRPLRLAHRALLPHHPEQRLQRGVHPPRGERRLPPDRPQPHERDSGLADARSHPRASKAQHVDRVQREPSPDLLRRDTPADVAVDHAGPVHRRD